MKNLYTDYKCIKCLFDKYSKIEDAELNENDKTFYIKDLLKIIQDAPITMSSPEIVEKTEVVENISEEPKTAFDKMKAFVRKAVDCCIE